MSSGSKHRRVKSIARGFEADTEVSTEGSRSTSASASTSTGVSSSASTSLSAAYSKHSSPPSLHTRSSSSSIQTLAATFEPADANASGLLPPYAPSAAAMASRRPSSSSQADPAARGDIPRADGGGGQPPGGGMDTPSLESAEQEDEFLPMNSPFAPGYSMSSSNSSPTYRRDSLGNISPETPASLSAADRREHSRRHSRIHSRNLSVFFPRPEQAGIQGYAPQAAPEEQYASSNNAQADIPVAQTRGWGFANDQRNKALAPGWQAEQAQQHTTQPSSRRGHHHRHSMSHNFFPFLDGSPRRTSGNANLSPQHSRHSHGNGISPTTADNHPVPSNLNTPRSVPAPASRHRHTASDPSLIPSITSLNSKYAHLPLPIRLFLGIAFHLPFFTQLVLTVACLEIALGASLWISGQSGESLAVTGLGYLVVFDGLAAISGVMIEGNVRGTDKLWSIISGRRAGDNAVRFPYGTSRINTISHFAQCVYLIFSAVYVCKESIEHVLLLHGPDEMIAEFGMGPGLNAAHEGIQDAAAHGATHGGMGHGEIVGHGGSGDWHDLGVIIPTKLLILSISACFFLALAAKNHVALTEAVGTATYSLPARKGPASKSRMMTAIHNTIVCNPFALTVLVFASTLTISSLLIPAQQLAPLDKVVALLESIAMFYIAYPAAVTTGKVLLQTAPPGIETLDGDMGRFKRVIEEIENHASVVFLPTPHIWQLNPHPPPAPTLLTKPSAFGRKSFSQPSPTSKEPTVTIVTLNVQVKPECTDEEILRLTSWARERCLSALAAGSSSSPGYSNGGVDLKTSQRPGAVKDLASSAPARQHQVELTVQVMRFEEDRALQGEVGRQSHSHSHSHGHSHGHDAHSHSHGEQGEQTRHVVEHARDHSHSHDAHSGAHGHHH